MIALVRLIYAFCLAHWGVIATLAAAAYGWSSNLFSAFVAALPDPDNPAEWPTTKYRVFFRTMQHWNNRAAVPPKL